MFMVHLSSCQLSVLVKERHVVNVLNKGSLPICNCSLTAEYMNLWRQGYIGCHSLGVP